MKRRQFWRAGVSAMAIVAIGATFNAAAPAFAEEAEIRFSWWGGPGRNDKTNQIIELFEAENPGTTVVRENSDWPGHWDKLTIQASAGNQPCTIQMQNRRLEPYASPNILRPLDDLVADGSIDVTGIAEPTLETGRGTDGNLYMIPTGVFYFAMMMNRSALEASGVEEPPIDWTWDDLAQLLRDIKPTLPEGMDAAHNMGQEANTFVGWVQSHGHKMVEDNAVAFPKETVVEWFEFWEALRNEGLTNSAELMTEETSALMENSNISTGSVFITERPPNRLGGHQTIIDTVRPGDTLGIIPYPNGPAGSGMDVGTNGLSIGAGCGGAELDAAVAWINFFTQDERAAAIYESDNGVVSVDRFQTAQAEGANTSAPQREQIEVFAKLAPNAKPVIWTGNSYGALQDALYRNYQAVAFGLMSPDEAADVLIEEINDQIQ